MAGHSKWANIKHRKEKEDARRGKVFTKIARQITVAVREGGADLNANFRLRVAVEQARAVNMPNDNIERAVKRGTGELAGESFEEMTYEGYGPGGVAILLEVTTDNRNRTAGDVRHLFSKHGGNLGESGCVAWMFEPKGIIQVPNSVDEETVTLAAIEAGAQDIESEDEAHRITTARDELIAVREALEAANISVSDASVEMVPTTTVDLAEAEAKRLVALIDALEDHDDIQQVYTNAALSDEVLASLQA